MRNIILLFFLSVTSGMAAAQSRTDSLYSLLDEAIANSDRYVEKREGYIRHTRGMYANLDESNRVKEKYIGLFLRQCSSYIDRMDSMRVDTLSMLKAKRYADLLQTVKNHNFRDRERDELLEIFDSTFIGLFPTFVDEFNMLLRPDCRIVPDDMSRLTTGIRIFALIRLGIDDSSKIAEFLHFSVNTIYNYRAKIKNGAAVSRDEFEDYVRAIGLPTD